MRRIIVTLWVITSTFALAAQDSPSFTCAEGNRYQSQFTIIPPDISEQVTDVTVTALGQGNYTPIIGITDADDFTDCYEASREAEFYELTLPTGVYPPTFTNASGIVFGEGANTVEIGEINDTTGALVVLLESFIFEDDHTYQLTLTEAILEASADASLSAYLVSLDAEYQPMLTLTDSEGETVTAEPTEVELYSILGDAFDSVRVPLPETPGDIRLTVGADEFGVYALILELQSGAVQTGDGQAVVTATEDNMLTLTCDDLTIFENGIRVRFPDDATYTATVLSNNSDPVLAVLDVDDIGTCYDDTPDTIAYTLELPVLTVTRDLVFPQASITPDDRSIVFGGRESAPDNYLLIVEGGTVEAGDEGDLFEIDLTPSMLATDGILSAYVFTTDLELNPILTWEHPDDDPVVCDDAGIPDLCDQDLADFDDARVTLADNLTVRGVDLNPALEIPMADLLDVDSVRLRVTAFDESAGEYLLVLYLVTD
ncbi:MAG: hypothetical protein ACFE0Q_16810 [Anaerolineae bacterium]